jgi:hypothetical protein
MTIETDVDSPLLRTLDIREKIAHIDQMLADHDRKRQEIRLAWWPIFLAGMASAAALIGATVAATRVFMP